MPEWSDLLGRRGLSYGDGTVFDLGCNKNFLCLFGKHNAASAMKTLVGGVAYLEKDARDRSHALLLGMRR